MNTQTAIIRLAAEEDTGAILEIYAPLVLNTAISFEVKPPAPAEMRKRIKNTQKKLPWLVFETPERLLGYVYASPHRSREAYQWSLDVSTYVHEDAHRKGIGKALYTSLFNILVLQGYFNAYAGITLPNPSSVGLHEALGFSPVGVYENVGFKLGAWHNVGWWQLSLQEKKTAPRPPLSLPQIQNTPEFAAALKSGMETLKSY